MAWLSEEDLDDWVEVINYEGDFLGWMKARECHHLGVPLNIIETPPFYKEHPILLHHAKMTYESDVLKSHDESGLSDIQTILLASIIIRRNEDEELLRSRSFEENLFINNPEVYNIYRERKEIEEMEEFDGIAVQERVPQNLEEFLSVLGSFDEETLDDEEYGDSGWLDSVLSDEELNSMGE